MVASSRGTSSSTSSMSGGGVGGSIQAAQQQGTGEVGGQFSSSSASSSSAVPLASNGMLTGSAGQEAMKSDGRSVHADGSASEGFQATRANGSSSSIASSVVSQQGGGPSAPPGSTNGHTGTPGGESPPVAPPPPSASAAADAAGGGAARRLAAPLTVATAAAPEAGADDDEDEDMSSGRSTFTCKHCKKEFTLKGNLKRHILTHAGVKPYICAICNKGFSRKADLEIHNRVHTGEKPYECPSPSCGKRFARISDLRSHERTHSGVKAFKCPFRGCDRQFARRYDMKKHAKVHQKEPAHHRRHAERDEYSSGDDSMDTGKYSSDSESSNGHGHHHSHHRVPKKTAARGSRAYGRRGGSSSAWSNGPMDGGSSSYSYNVPSDVDAAYRMQAMRGGGGPIPPRGGMDRGGYDAILPMGTPLNHPAERSLRRPKPASETRGYRVLHNSHVDLLSPNGVLECRESGVKVVHGEVPLGSTRLPKKLTEEDVFKASANCGGEHGTEHCTCIQIEHDGHVCYIVDGRLVHRTREGQYEDHGEFRILDDDFLAFYEGIESLVQDQSVTRPPPPPPANGAPEGFTVV